MLATIETQSLMHGVLALDGSFGADVNIVLRFVGIYSLLYIASTNR